MLSERIYVFGVPVKYYVDENPLTYEDDKVLVDSFSLWASLELPEETCPAPVRVSNWNGFCHTSKPACPIDVTVQTLIGMGCEDFARELDSRL